MGPQWHVFGQMTLMSTCPKLATHLNHCAHRQTLLLDSALPVHVIWHVTEGFPLAVTTGGVTYKMQLYIGNQGGLLLSTSGTFLQGNISVLCCFVPFIAKHFWVHFGFQCKKMYKSWSCTRIQCRKILTVALFFSTWLRFCEFVLQFCRCSCFMGVNKTFFFVQHLQRCPNLQTSPKSVPDSPQFPSRHRLSILQWKVFEHCGCACMVRQEVRKIVNWQRQDLAWLFSFVAGPFIFPRSGSSSTQWPIRYKARDLGVSSLHCDLLG